MALVLLGALPAAAQAASAETGAASGVRSSSATLNGQLDPTGDPGITACRFEYVTEAAFGATGFADLSSGGEAPCSPAPPYAGPSDVSAAIAGLEAGEAYRFRVVAVTTSSGTLNGAAQKFETVHGELGSFGEDGTEASSFGGFGQVFELGFDQAKRRLYVVDQPIRGIWGFDVSSPPPPLPPEFPLLAGFAPLQSEALSATGESVRGITVDNSESASAGNVYYVAKPTYGFDSNGAPFGAPFELAREAGSAAVDSAGHVWIEGSIGNKGVRLDEYAAEGGQPLETVLDTELPSGMVGLDGIAIGAADELYAFAEDHKSIWRLDPASGYREGEPFIESESGEALGSALAFDRRSHHLYVTGFDKEAIAEYDAAGTKVDEFGEVAGAIYLGLAVDETNHYIYAGDASVSVNKVRVFAAGAAFPAFELEDPSPLADTAATLRATVNPEGTALSQCRFEYVSEDAFQADRAIEGHDGFSDLSSGGGADCEPDVPADEADHAVSAQIEGLSPHTAYRWRLIVANAAGPTSALESFTTPGPPAVETTGSPVPGPTEALLSGRVNPEGAATRYRFQYVTEAAFEASGFADLSSGGQTPEVELSSDEVQRVRSFGNGSFTLGFGGESTPALPAGASAAQVQSALEGLSAIEAGEVSVAGGRSFGDSPSAYSVSFEGALGGVDVGRLAGSTGVVVDTPIPGGVGREARPVAARVGGLEPDTAYRYRLVADNEGPGGPSLGAAMALTTPPASPPSNGGFPGPPGSDRAWELVSIPDSGGNPVAFALGYSVKADRAVYQVSGGTPISASGTFFSQLLAVRRETEPHKGGWEQINMTPRSLYGPHAPDWFFFPDTGLRRFAANNVNGTAPLEQDIQSLWQITPPDGPYTQLVGETAGRSTEFFEASDDGARIVAAYRDALDPTREEETDSAKFHLYDVSGGSPRLLDLLPEGEAPAPCGIEATSPTEGGTSGSVFGIGHFNLGGRRWLSADGRLAVFPSKGAAPECGEKPAKEVAAPVQLYLRDIAAGQTKEISAPVLSGDECSAAFIRASAEAVFFWTQSRLAAEDGEPEGCDNQPGLKTLDGDVYRYRFSDGELSCLTCVAPGRDADVRIGAAKNALADVGVSADGSAVYFSSPHRLLAGAAKEGIYRVNGDGGGLAFVAAGEAQVGDALGGTSAVSADGGVLVFRSADPRLDPQGGQSNGGFQQYYRYEHGDRSLICVSCPPDDGAPRGDVVGLNGFGGGSLTANATYNGSPLSADGSVFAFDTPTALVGADQNTTAPGENPQHGQDVYEWRDGRARLLSDGLGSWPGGGALGFSEVAPEPAGVSPDGQTVYLFAAARYTPDALDDYRRLYAARIGGGFEFPPEQPECDLEVCQGTPAGAPEPAPAGSAGFHGAGNPRAGAGCTALARRARALALGARRARRAARRGNGASRRRALRRRAHRLSRRARKLGKRARRCRRAERRAGR